MAFRTLCSGLEFGIKQMRQFGFIDCNGIAATASIAIIAIVAIIATLPTVGAGALGGRFGAGCITRNLKHNCREEQRIGKSTNVAKVQGAIAII